MIKTSLEDILHNIFPVARGVITSPLLLRDDVDRAHSSQALCISVWGTFGSAEGRAVRRLICEQLDDALFAQVAAEHSTTAPFFEHFDSNLLNEVGGKPSNLDAVLRFGSLLGVVVESKLGEPLGSCSQARPKRKLTANCTGVYGPGSDQKPSTRDRLPVCHCRLDILDRGRYPRRYWEVMRAISNEGAYPIGERCPFAGSGFQVMRNIASAVRYAEHEHLEDWRVVFAYPPSLSPETGPAIEDIVRRLVPDARARILHLDYEQLARRLLGETELVAHALGEYLRDRLLACARRKRVSLAGL